VEEKHIAYIWFTFSSVTILDHSFFPLFFVPGGLYNQVRNSKELQDLGVRKAKDIFGLSFFKGNPLPFWMMVKEFLFGEYKPTKSHYFLKLLEKKGKLLKVIRQNFHGLESAAGVSDKFCIQAHGTCSRARCVSAKCPNRRKPFDMKWIQVTVSSAFIFVCVY
jgi:NAD-dependent SIR2 family protein deacetylase